MTGGLNRIGENYEIVIPPCTEQVRSFLMDHFNLNAIITSLSDDTLDKQIKVKQLDDNSEELLQESLLISSEPKIKQTKPLDTPTEKPEIPTPKVQMRPTDSSTVIHSAPAAEVNVQPIVDDAGEVVHIVMPAGWSPTADKDNEQETTTNAIVKMACPFIYLR